MSMLIRPYARVLCFSAAALGLSACQGPRTPSTTSATDVANPTRVEAGYHREGRFYVGPAPTPERLAQLKANGIKTVIDLRDRQESSPEEAQAARDLGLMYLPVPMKSDHVTTDQAQLFLHAMQLSRDEPVLIHCGSGNRAGGMYGLYLGYSRACKVDEAMRRAKAAGLRNPSLEADVRAYIAGNARPAGG